MNINGDINKGRKHLIYAVDFDGTLCKHAFPKIGAPNDILIKAIKEKIELGDKIILWTCRGGKYLDNAVKWCKDKGIVLSAVNEDLPEVKDTEFGRTKSGKVYADYYIDDRNLMLNFTFSEDKKNE